jgi:hypothetical protein
MIAVVGTSLQLQSIELLLNDVCLTNLSEEFLTAV